MNKLTIIGNLTADPISRQTTAGSVCNFNVAVNNGKDKNGNDRPATYFRVAAWNKLGEVCQSYLAKGRKVCVIGPISATAYTDKDGAVRANLELMANDIEFLGGANSSGEAKSSPAPTAKSKNKPIDDASAMKLTPVEDELPW